MKHESLYHPFEVVVSDLSCWQQRPLIQHFFEIVQILEGHGTRTVNSNAYAYEPGDLFLLTPRDYRGFTSQTATRFCSFRFAGIFLQQCRVAPEQQRIGNWLLQLERIFYQHNRFQPLVIRQSTDRQAVDRLLETIRQEYEQRLSYREQNLQQLLTVVLNVLARNVAATTLASAVDEEPEPLINRLLPYLRLNITEPERIRIKHLAAHFNLSEHYVGEYFRKATGESLQHYLTQYRLGLVQQRLTSSALTVSQIANELGYSDESYLSRQFRKYFGMSPQAYRKRQINATRWA